MNSLIHATAQTEVPNMFFVAMLGISIVFIGLICIIILVTLMGALCRRSGDTENAPTPSPAPAAPAVPAAVPVQTDEIPNKQQLIAAITAAIAEELGTDISALRVHSLRRVGGAAGAAADPAHSELVAAISAALAEELGSDISRIRIHSLRRIG